MPIADDKWGTMIEYQQQELPLIAVKNFTLTDDKSNKSKWCPNKWKDVHIVIRSFDMDDLVKQNNLSAAAENPEGGQEKGEIEEDDVFIEYQTPCRLVDE